MAPLQGKLLLIFSLLIWLHTGRAADASAEAGLLHYLQKGIALSQEQADSLQGVWVQVPKEAPVMLQGHLLDQLLLNYSAASGLDAPALWKDLAAASLVYLSDQIGIIHVDPTTGIFFGYRVPREKVEAYNDDVFVSPVVRRLTGVARPAMPAEGAAAQVLYLQYTEDQDTALYESYVYPDKAGKLNMRTSRLEGFEIFDGDGLVLDNQVAITFHLEKADDTLASWIGTVVGALPLRANVAQM